MSTEVPYAFGFSLPFPLNMIACYHVFCLFKATKMQKHVGLDSTKKKNQTRWDSHDNTFTDYHPYIDLSNHTHHNLPCLHTTHIQSHTTQHTVTTTRSPRQLHLLYTQNQGCRKQIKSGEAISIVFPCSVRAKHFLHF